MSCHPLTEPRKPFRSLTRRQARVLAVCRQFARANGYPPTVRELSASLRLSVNGSQCHLKALEKKGWITRSRPNNPRSIRFIPFALQVLQIVRRSGRQCIAEPEEENPRRLVAAGGLQTWRPVPAHAGRKLPTSGSRRR